MVGTVGGVEAVGGLPGVRHPVRVGVGRRLGRGIDGVPADVVLGVDERPPSPLDQPEHAPVHGVAHRPRRADVGEQRCLEVGGGRRRHGRGGERHGHADRARDVVLVHPARATQSVGRTRLGAEAEEVGREDARIRAAHVERALWRVRVRQRLRHHADVVHLEEVGVGVARLVAPAGDEVVAEVEAHVLRARVAALVEGVDRVVDGRLAGRRDQRAVAVRALVVDRPVEALGDQAVLHCHRRRAADDAQRLVRRPAHRAVVDDGRPVPHVDRVLLLVRGVARPHAEVAQDHLGRVHLDAVAREHDAVAGSRLPGDGQEPVPDVQRADQLDGARDPEDDRPRPLRLDGRTERPRDGLLPFGVVGQRGDERHLPPASADRPHPVALRARERGNRLRGGGRRPRGEQERAQQNHRPPKPFEDRPRRVEGGGLHHSPACPLTATPSPTTAEASSPRL